MAAANSHAHIVLRAMSTRWRAKIRSRRYSGRWSPSLLVMMYASRPGPGRPFSMGWGVLVAVSICGLRAACSHWLQAYLWRMFRRTLRDAGRYSSFPLASWPLRRLKVPQQG